MIHRDPAYNRTDMTGPPDGRGPQTEENRGAFSIAGFGVEERGLRVDGSWVVARIRVAGEFPGVEGDQSIGRIYFTEKRADSAIPVDERIIHNGSWVTVSDGNPPLLLEDCEVILRAALPGRFLRCDAGGDAELNVTDAVLMLLDLFGGGGDIPCRTALDCNGDDENNVTDPIYLLTFLFLGGPEAPPPFTECGRVPGMTLEECPSRSTACDS
jgi:hypothetical protein